MMSTPKVLDSTLKRAVVLQLSLDKTWRRVYIVRLVTKKRFVIRLIAALQLLRADFMDKETREN